MKPYRLQREFKEKVWGSTRLEPWYPNPDQKIGEVWFESDPPLPILIKLIFTEEALSVQVHPGDEYAQAHADSLGKTEMWHVLRADPGAVIGMGLKETITPQRLREASLSGEIQQMLNWVAVAPGDTFHIPAGTVHAIGAGVVLCEIQQQSDVTYRLYDYGRPRELHLDHAVEVSDPGPWKRQVPPPGFIASCPYFAVRRMEVREATTLEADAERFQVVIFLAGQGGLAGQPFKAGEAWYLPPGRESYTVDPDGTVQFLLTYVP